MTLAGRAVLRVCGGIVAAALTTAQNRKIIAPRVYSAHQNHPSVLPQSSQRVAAELVPWFRQSSPPLLTWLAYEHFGLPLKLLVGTSIRKVQGDQVG